MFRDGTSTLTLPLPQPPFSLSPSLFFHYPSIQSSNSASSQFISLSLEPVPSSKSRINQTKKKSNLKATQTSPSKFSWKEDHSTYMFAGTAGIPCGTEGEFMVHLDDHVKVNGKMVKESHVFGPYNVTTETCKEATQPQKA